MWLIELLLWAVCVVIFQSFLFQSIDWLQFFHIYLVYTKRWMHTHIDANEFFLSNWSMSEVYCDDIVRLTAIYWCCFDSAMMLDGWNERKERKWINFEIELLCKCNLSKSIDLFLRTNQIESGVENILKLQWCRRVLIWIVTSDTIEWERTNKPSEHCVWGNLNFSHSANICICI